MTRWLIATLLLALLTGCSGACPAPLSRDWLGQCSQKGGM
jgi:hypothetical protein